MEFSTDNRPERLRFDLSGILTAVAAACLAATVLLAFIQVVLRYVFNAPLTWTEEAGRYLFIWSVFLGMAVAYGRNEHLKVTTLIDLLPGKIRQVFTRLAVATDLLALALLLFSGCLVAWGHRAAASYSIPGFPQVVFYLAVPVGAVSAICLVVRRVVLSRGKP